MGNMKYFASTMNELPECWLHKNRQFIHVEGNWRCGRTLPTISISHENILKELNILYRVIKDEYGNEMYEYWDSECYKQMEVTLPLYIKLPSGGYRYANKNHTQLEIDQETEEAANKLTDKLWKAIYALEEKKEKEKLYQELKGVLDGKAACGYYRIKCLKEDFVFNEDHFKVIQVMIPRRTSPDKSTNWYAVFDVNKIELNSVLTLEVPKGKEGMFVGTNGWQVKEWCKKLGLQRINIVGV